MRLLNPYGHWHNRGQLLSRIKVRDDFGPVTVITYTQGHKTKGVRIYNDTYALRVRNNKRARYVRGHPDYLRVNDLIELVNTIIARGEEIEI